MIKGLYTSTMGMLGQEAKMDVVTNNLANANTNAYKRDRITFEEFPHILEHRLNDVEFSPGQKTYRSPKVGPLGTGVILDRITTDHVGGSLAQTDNKTDFALTGKAYFAVQTENGVRFTRNGRFHFDRDGFLLTENNEKVLGYSQDLREHTSMMKAGEAPSPLLRPIQVANPINFNVNQEGQINNTEQSIAKMVFKNTNFLEKDGKNNFRLIEGEALLDTRNEMRQNYIEKSNINVVNEMVNMVKVNRAYEANSKILTSIDERIGQVVSTLGRLR